MARGAFFGPPRRVRALHDRLYAAYGPQGWWPGDTRLEIIVGAVLTQNTAWTNVERAIARLKAADVLRLETLLHLPLPVLADCLRPAGYYNLKAERLVHLLRVVSDAGGERALDRLATDELRSLLLGAKGTGPETADDILLYAFQRPVFVIDAYTRRLLGRLGWADGTEGYDALRRGMEKACGGDVAMMQDLHALIVHHAKVACRKQPLCALCPLRRSCEAFRKRDSHVAASPTGGKMR